ncbi:hypothetical protein NE562_11660 [Butyricicoccus faecihominis]|uniref:phage replication initiation protein, NGO0469 family n=1 Tax=Butyricicoccus faecihominis TaxID=1712515 RepID=UPI002478DF87|nr:hypothetical protein [Butyricicoccus faecihominis]MCQ5130319.1 hypothetical protein [Butyricicoccus faecihominis]
MKLKDKIRPSDPPLEDDIYDAVCVMVADVGQQVNPFNQKIENRVLFLFEIPSQIVERDGKQAPRTIPRWFNYTVDDKGALKPALTSWLGKSNMTKSEMLDLDLFDFAGMGARIMTGIGDNGKNKIENIKPLKRGVSIPKNSSPILTFDIDEDGFESEAFFALPDWVQEIIEKSEQYQQDPPSKKLDMPEEEGTADGNEEGCPI